MTSFKFCTKSILELREKRTQAALDARNREEYASLPAG
jgi:hypothetical protein